MSCVLRKRISAIYACCLLLVIAVLATFSPVSADAAENSSDQKSLLLERSIRLDDAYDFADHSSGLLYWKAGTEVFAIVQDKEQNYYIATFDSQDAQTFWKIEIPAGTLDVSDVVQSGQDIFLLMDKRVCLIRKSDKGVYETIKTVVLSEPCHGLLESNGRVYAVESRYRSVSPDAKLPHIDYKLYDISDGVARLVFTRNAEELSGIIVNNLGPTRLSTVVRGDDLIEADPYGRFLLVTDLKKKTTDTVELHLFGDTPIHDRVVALDQQTRNHSIQGGKAIAILRSLLKDEVLQGVVLRVDELTDGKLGLLVERSQQLQYYVLTESNGEFELLRSLTRETLDMEAKVSDVRLLGVNSTCKASDSVILSTRSSGAVDPLSGLTYREVMQAEEEYLLEHETPESIIILVVE